MGGNSTCPLLYIPPRQKRPTPKNAKVWKPPKKCICSLYRVFEAPNTPDKAIKAQKHLSLGIIVFFLSERGRRFQREARKIRWNNHLKLVNTVETGDTEIVRYVTCYDVHNRHKAVGCSLRSLAMKNGTEQTLKKIRCKQATCRCQELLHAPGKQPGCRMHVHTVRTYLF